SAAALRVGDPLDEGTDIGAVGSSSRLARIKELTGSADADGAQRWTSPAPLPEQGLYYPPTVFSEVGPAMRIAREELVGPVLTVLTFRTPEEAAAVVNNTPGGLGTGIWTDQGSRLTWAARQLRVGVVWANTGARVDPTAPFGGYRESGGGRDGGRAGLAPYLDV
ncbi:MAG: aldehyde dehydrogenase family protein, partial [Pseudonocardiaceae bacterium]